MTGARHLQLLQEIRDGQDGFTGGSSDAEQRAATAKLGEWYQLSERFEITLQTSYSVTVDGPQLRHATATLTPAGTRVLEQAKRRAAS